jgi:chromosome segregation ATPase
MARPAEFTDKSIRQQIEDMASAGKTLTASGVRLALGGGNMTRIANVLKNWKEANAPIAQPEDAIILPIELQSEVDGRMAELSAGLSSTIARIHRRATEIAESRVTEAVKAANSAAAGAQAELVDAHAALEQSDEQIGALREEIDALKQSEMALRERAAAAEARAHEALEERKRGEERERHLSEELSNLRRLLETHLVSASH